MQAFDYEQSQSERDLIALSIAAVLPDGSEVERRSARDAGYLAKHRARISAIGLTTGLIHSDADEIRVRYSGTKIFCGAPETGSANAAIEASPKREVAALRGLGQQLATLSSPLIVTCGGRTHDLLLLRYRCMAHAIPLAHLHFAIGPRWKYFERYDAGWHLDLGDFLSGHGASCELTLHDLCALAAIKYSDCNARYEDRVSEESEAIFSLFLRFLHVTGRMSEASFGVASSDMATKAHHS